MVRLKSIFFYFIVYICYLLNADIFGLVALYLPIDIPYIMIMLSGGVITVGEYLVFRKRIVIEKYNIDAMAWMFIFIILACGIVRGIIPDTSSDVARAHIFFQRLGFEDNIYYNAFPAGYTFYFYLSDDFAYFFRLFFGYRMGTLANAFILVVTFLELRDLLVVSLGNTFKKIRNGYIEKSVDSPIYAFVLFAISESFFAGIACLTYFAVSELGSYMSDLVSLPLMVYLLRNAIKKEEDTTSGQFISYAFFCGISFALKQTTIVFLFPVLILYLIKNRHHIHFYQFVICFFVGVIPAAPYLIYAYVSTGNPVYITYNSFFKSPYYLDEDFKDLRWGPETISDALLWPIKLIVNNKTRVGEIIIVPLVYVFLGWLSVFQYIILSLRKKKGSHLKTTAYIVIIFVVSYGLWLYTTGYMRYAIIVEILSILLIAFNAATRYEVNNKLKILPSIVLCLIVAFNCVMYVVLGILNQYDYSWRGKLGDNISSGVFQENAGWIFRDRSIGNQEQHAEVDVFLCMYDGNVYATLFDPDIPIVGAGNISQYLGAVSQVKEIDYVGYYKSRVAEYLKEGKGVYDISRLSSIDRLLDLAEAWGVEIDSIELLDSFFIKNNKVALIKYKELNIGNEILEIGQDPVYLERVNDTCNKLHGLIYLHPWYADETSVLQISVVSSDLTEKKYDFSIHADEVVDLSKIGDKVNINLGDSVSICIVEGVQNAYAVNLRIEEE